jgi:hypothetical protein
VNTSAPGGGFGQNQQKVFTGNIFGTPTKEKKTTDDDDDSLFNIGSTGKKKK